MTTTVGTTRPGGRTARTRLAVLKATRHELLRHGYSDFCIERIAGRAKVHKTTLYRRWNDRTGLIADLISTMANTTVPVPDFGSVDRDLRQFARELCTLLNGESGELIAAVFAAARQDKFLGERLRNILEDRYATTTVVIERAVQRGELPLNTDPDAVIRQVAAPLYYDLMVLGSNPRARDADRAAASTLIAARAGALARNTPRKASQSSSPGQRPLVSP